MRIFDAKHVPKPKVETLPESNLPLDIEIGAGAGLHAIRYSQNNPNRFLVAIEHTQTRFAKLYRRFENHEHRSNLRPLHENAISVITHLVKNESVENVFLLYPNPFPKARDLNKRWHAMPFMQKIIDVLKMGGKIHLATNEKFYADEAREYFQNIWRLKMVVDEKITDPKLARTHFEKKYLESGQTCYNIVFEKN